MLCLLLVNCSVFNVKTPTDFSYIFLMHVLGIEVYFSESHTHKTLLIVLCMAFSLPLMCERCKLDVYFALKDWLKCTLFEQFK